jgi:SAM-dependent methyltransferase
MAFEDVMGTAMQWATATEALAALGAQLALADPSAGGDPEVVAAVRAVGAAAGLDGVDELAAPQRAMLLAMIRMYLRQAVDTVEEADRAPGWTFTDPVILEGWGRGSAMLPGLIAGSHPDLAGVTSLLDVGTGVGLLAIAAANVWPDATIVGIDRWEPSLERARANVASARLEDRITMRAVDVVDLDATDEFDCAWIPTFFLDEPTLAKGVAAAVAALHPGGWIVLGINRPSPSPLADATSTLRYLRSGGTLLDPAGADAILVGAGCEDVHRAPPAGPAPIELVLGRRPAA